jgi:hypothetical protein
LQVEIERLCADSAFYVAVIVGATFTDGENKQAA